MPLVVDFVVAYGEQDGGRLCLIFVSKDNTQTVGDRKTIAILHFAVEFVDAKYFMVGGISKEL